MILFREDAMGVFVNLCKANKRLDHLYLVLEIVNSYLLLAI